MFSVVVFSWNTDTSICNASIIKCQTYYQIKPIFFHQNNIYKKNINYVKAEVQAAPPLYKTNK